MLSGAFGEVAALRDAEWRAFTVTIVDAVAGRVPVVAGSVPMRDLVILI